MGEGNTSIFEKQCSGYSLWTWDASRNRTLITMNMRKSEGGKGQVVMLEQSQSVWLP